MRHIIRSIVPLALTVAVYALAFLFTAPDAAAQGTTFNSPTRFTNIQQFVAAALQILVWISLPIISVAVVYSGFLFVLARGNKTELERAKRNFLYVIIGTILVLGAATFANLLGATFTQLVTGS